MITIYQIRHNISRFSGVYGAIIERLFTEQINAEQIYDDLKQYCNEEADEFIELTKYIYKPDKYGELHVIKCEPIHCCSIDTKY